jgi:hypothetical protein
MKRLYFAATVWLVLGLGGGLYYRELTKAHDFTEQTQLSVVHTHLLTLGVMFFLILLALERLFTLSASRLFNWFFWIYSLGLVWTVALLAIHGTRTVLGMSSGAVIAGLAGLGHILLTAGFALLFVCLYQRIRVPQAH